MFVGQEGLKKHIMGLVGAKQFPQFAIIVGSKGSGRSTLVEHVAQLMSAPVLQPESLKVDDIRVIIGGASKLSNTMIHYLKDADDLTPQAENALLKLAEEPPKNCYIIMSVLDAGNVLPTIQSRGKLFRMETYKADELSQFTSDKLILSCATNIGEIKELEDVGAKGLYDFAVKVVENIGKVSTLNSLNIYKQIQLKEDEQGFPLGLFFNMMLHVCTAKMVKAEKEQAVRYVETMKLIYQYKGMFKVKGANKLALFDIFVLDLCKVWRDK